MLDYLLELNRSRPAVQRRIVNLSTRTLPWSRSGEIVSSILPMERPLRESLQASRATFGRVSSCRDRESAPLIITTLEILWLEDTPWTISRVAKHAISKARRTLYAVSATPR